MNLNGLIFIIKTIQNHPRVVRGGEEIPSSFVYYLYLSILVMMIR